MKTRTDFVSNSSSSSFVLFGDVFELDFLEKELMNNEDTQLYADYLNEKDRRGSYSSMYFIGNAFARIAKEKYGVDLDWHQGLEDYGNDSIVFGMDFHQMKNDETKQQFLNRIEDILKKLFPKVEVKVGLKMDQGYE